jgi:hypothetical protein
MLGHALLTPRRVFFSVALIGAASACATAGDGLTAVDVDASPADIDAGLSLDEGGATFDSGYAIDSGSTVDSGTTLDAGALHDGSAPVDAGHPIDSGVAVDSGGGGVDSGVLCAQQGYSGALVTFDLTAQPGNEASASAASSASGVTAGALTRSSALSASASTASGSINTTNWPTTATPDTSRYYTFTITPSATCAVTLATMAIDVRASATGPATASVATSADGFASRATFAGSGTANVAITGASNTSGAIEVRIYGYSATSSGGTFRIQNTLTLSGSIN